MSRSTNIKRKISELIIHFHTVFFFQNVLFLTSLDPCILMLGFHKGNIYLGGEPSHSRGGTTFLLAFHLFQRNFFQAEDFRVRRTVWNLPSCQDARWQDNSKTFAEVANENAELRIAENFPSWRGSPVTFFLYSLLSQEIVCPWGGAVYIWKPARGIQELLSILVDI